MIHSISLQNFQSHRDSTLKFSDGVNVILGASDSGKTAIIRAIRKLASNKPSGDEMKSHWGGKLQIEMFTDDAHVVYSKDKEAEYILGDNIPFKAFGTSVPDEITKALNLSEINTQAQLDSPFLLSSTAGQVAEHFNKVCHLEVIDKATSSVNSEISELNSIIGREAIKDKPATGLIKQIADAEEKLLQFEHLTKFEIDVEVLEEMEKQFKQLCNSKDKLENLVSELQDIEAYIQDFSKILILEKPVNDILNLIELRAEKDLEEVKLDKLVCQIKEVQSKLINQNAVLLVEKPVNDLLKLYKEKEMAVNEQKQLFKALESIQGIQRQLNIARVNYASLHGRFEKEFPNKCPLCGTIIKK